MLTQAKIDAARAYVSGIRNAKKKWYGQQCLSYMLRWTSQPPDSDGLSVMGQQAVRMRLAELLGEGAMALPC